MRPELSYTRYQLQLLVGVYVYSYLMFCPNQLFPIFANISPQWTCPELGIYIPTDNCTLLELCGANITIESVYTSAVEEMGLYCDMSHIGPTVASLQMGGLLVGSVVFGQVGDMFGRKPTSLISIAGVLLFSFGSTFAHVWQLLAALRFMVGFFIGGYVIGVFTLIMEMIEPQHRIFVRACVNFWGGSRVIYALVAYLTMNWRDTFRILNALVAPILLLIAFRIQESPRWLIQHHKIKKAERALMKIAHVNHTVVLESQITALEKAAASDRRYTYKDLFFSSPELRKRTFLCAFVYFSCACVSYGMDLKTGKLAANVYLNTVLIGVCIMLGKPLIFIVDTYVPGFSRRLLHQVSMTATLVCLVIIAILINYKGPVVDVAITVVSLIGMVVLEWGWDAVYLYGIELFPTVVRSQGFAFSAIVGRLGNTIAPYVVYLDEFWEPAALVVFIALGVAIVIVSCFLLPDTKGLALPDTLDFKTVSLEVEEAERLVENTKV